MQPNEHLTQHQIDEVIGHVSAAAIQCGWERNEVHEVVGKLTGMLCNVIVCEQSLKQGLFVPVCHRCKLPFRDNEAMHAFSGNLHHEKCFRESFLTRFRKELARQRQYHKISGCRVHPKWEKVVWALSAVTPSGGMPGPQIDGDPVTWSDDETLEKCKAHDNDYGRRHAQMTEYGVRWYFDEGYRPNGKYYVESEI